VFNFNPTVSNISQSSGRTEGRINHEQINKEREKKDECELPSKANPCLSGWWPSTIASALGTAIAACVVCVCVCVCEMMMMAWLAGVLAAIAIAAFAIAMTGFGKSLLPSHPIQTVG
jgi:hypothetical protein